MKKRHLKDTRSTQLKGDLLSVAAVCLLSVLCTLPSVCGDFLNWDDDRFIVNNPNVSSLSVAHIMDAFSGLRFESYQPLHLVSFMLDGTLWRGRAPLYRLHSLVLFLCAVALLFVLLRKLNFSTFAAFVGCLFFSLAPYRAESVSWITGRKDVLMLFFALLTWHLHLAADAPNARSKWLRVLAVIGFALAMLSKSAALVMPPMMATVDITLRKKSLRSALLHAAPYLPLAVASAVLLPMIWSDASLIQQRPEEFGNPLALSAWTLFHYIKTVLFPFRLSPLYASPSAETVGRDAAICAMLLVFTATSIVYRIKKRQSLMPFVPIGLFLVALIPFLNFIPLYYLRADRYLLLPAVGLSLGIAAVIPNAEPPPKLAAKLRIFAVLLFIGVMGIGLAAESYHWHDSLRLWHHAVHREPDAFFARLKLGETLRNADNPEESVREYRAALAIAPLSPTALGGVFWGSLLADMRDRGLPKPAEAEKAAYSFISIANDGPKLQTLSRYLKQQRYLRAASVVDERLRFAR